MIPQLDGSLNEIQIQQRRDDAIRGNSRELLFEYLVRQIRMLRPEMVVISDNDAASAGTFASTRSLVELAVQRAGNPRQFEIQLERGGLQPWQVKSIGRVTQKEIGPIYRVTSSRLAL